MWLGNFDLKVLVKVISQASPLPAYIASLSSQSISTPSRLFYATKAPNLLAQSTGSIPLEVGNSVAPNALIKIFMSASLYFFFRVFCI